MADIRKRLTSGQKQTLLIALGWMILSASLGLPSLRSGSPAAPRPRDVQAAPAVTVPRESIDLPRRAPVVIDYPGPETQPLPPISPRPRGDGEEETPRGPGVVDGILPVPAQLTPVTLHIGDVVVGGCTMHNSNLTGALLVLSVLPGDPPGEVIQLLYLPGDRCFVFGSSGTRTTCTVDTAFDSEALPDQLGQAPVAGPPPLLGGTIAILIGLEETAQALGVPPPDLAGAIGEALGCKTVVI